jgi:hypothetical protein
MKEKTVSYQNLSKKPQIPSVRSSLQQSNHFFIPTNKTSGLYIAAKPLSELNLHIKGPDTTPTIFLLYLPAGTPS